MKYAFFTGATGGLGEACVRALCARNWTVFAAGTNEDRLLRLGAVERAVPVRADVTDTQSLLAARELVLQTTDRLDAVVNFAGLTAFQSLVEGDPAAAAERLLDVNVMGTVRTNAVFFGLVERGRGRIVNCSSSAGWMTAQPFIGPYVLSKRAIEGYSDSLRRELLYLGIPVIKLQPGSFRTRLTDDVYGEYARTLARTTRYGALLCGLKPLMDATLNRSGEPEALAKLVVKALEARRPRAVYRKGSGALLLLMELLPEPCVDAVYRALYRRCKKREARPAPKRP